MPPFLADFTTNQLQAFSYGFLFFILAITSFFILTTNWKNVIARRFAYVTIAGALVNILAFLYHTVDSIELARQFRIVSQSMGIPFIAGMLLFSISLYEKYRGHRPHFRLIGIACGALMAWFAPFFALDLFGSGHIIGPLLGDPSTTLTPEPGSLLIYYIASLLITWAFSVYLMASLLMRAATREARLMGGLMLLTMNLPILTRLFGYGPWYGVVSSDFLTLGVTFLTGPIFAFGVTYAVLRHQVFNLRLIAAELFVAGMWCFVFFRALLADSWVSAAPDIVLLVATIVLGIFLIRSVLQEVDHRERLQVLTGELKSLNETLEERVAERTRELARAKTHVEQVVENLTAGLVEYTGRHSIIRINRAAEMLLGVSRADVVGTTLGRAATAPALASLRAVLFPETGEGYAKPAEQPSGARLEEVTILAPQRRELQLTTASVPILEGGNRGYITLIRDVSREKQIDRTKSEFLTVAAHQLRTPLTAIRWTLRLFLDGGAGRVSKAQQELLTDGARAGENMLRIINDLLNVVRIEEGRFGFAPAPADFGHIITEAVGELKPAALAKKLSLSLTLPAGLPLALLDREKMKMAVQNLIDNAIKYTPEGGTVTVALMQRGRALALIITDTGIGIPKEEQERLFTKFFRAKRAIQMFTDGSGLGLFIAKSIIEQHSGTIRIESLPGKGTTVTIALPTTLRSA